MKSATEICSLFWMPAVVVHDGGIKWIVVTVTSSRFSARSSEAGTRTFQSTDHALDAVPLDLLLVGPVGVLVGLERLDKFRVFLAGHFAGDGRDDGRLGACDLVADRLEIDGEKEVDRRPVELVAREVY